MPDGIPEGRLKQLQLAGLVDSIRNGTATANGFVDETVRAVRVVAATDTELASMGPGRVSESNDLDLSKRTNRILAAVCGEEVGPCALTPILMPVLAPDRARAPNPRPRPRPRPHPRPAPPAGELAYHPRRRPEAAQGHEERREFWD